MPASVSKTCLVRFDNNKYSVTASAVRAACRGSPLRRPHCIDPPGRTHRCRACSLVRSRRYRLRSPALRAGAGSQTRCLAQPAPPSRTGCCQRRSNVLRRKLAGADDGNRQMVDILNAVLTRQLASSRSSLRRGDQPFSVHSADVVMLNILARQRDPAPPANIPTTPGCADIAPCPDRRLCPLRQSRKRSSDGTHSTVRPHG